MLEIPLNNEKNQEFNIILDEQECTIQIQSLNDNLYFSLYADDKQIIENTLVNIGIRILLNFSILFDLILNVVILHRHLQTCTF